MQASCRPQYSSSHSLSQAVLAIKIQALKNSLSSGAIAHCISFYITLAASEFNHYWLFYIYYIDLSFCRVVHILCSGDHYALNCGLPQCNYPTNNPQWLQRAHHHHTWCELCTILFLTSNTRTLWHRIHYLTIWGVWRLLTPQITIRPFIR